MTTAPQHSWKQFLQSEAQKPYYLAIYEYLTNATNERKIVYPPEEERFDAYRLTAPNQIKVVILGQDPYHGPNQANGLAFSVHKNIPTPPSLRNIYKELESDMKGFIIPNHGSLVDWAKQGVFLLNTSLSVEAANAASHAKIGWQNLTDATIQEINQQCQNIVFILWGSHAQKKRMFIDESKHLIIASAHPSPLSAYRGFFGSKPFSKTNDYLIRHNKLPINWQIS